MTLRLSEVDSTWSAVAARLAPLGGVLDTLTPLAVELGEAELAERLRAALTRVQQQDLGDPLAAAPGGRLGAPAQERLDRLEAEVTTARERLRELAALRDGYRQRIDGLVARIDGVAAAEQAVMPAFARATEKIVDPGLPHPPNAAAVLRTRLVELDRLRQAGRWSELAEDLATVEESVRRAQERAGELRGLADGLLARRDELRGRLDAYRAKAAGKGLAEHGELTARYTDAHDLLFTAPCDLRGSTRAVYAYQQALANLLEESR
jgi:DNA repair exonuclease SbcCD ATPase subunit